MPPPDLVAGARKHGAEDARKALDSGDYGYHKNEKGLSTLTLIDDFWSFAEARVLGTKADERTRAALHKEYRAAWREVIAEAQNPAPPATWAVEAGRLDLSDLGKIPAAIKGMASVKVLSLYGMKLPKLDPVLLTLPNVQEAFLQNNKFTAVPAGLSKWKKLRVLHLGSNPIANGDALGELKSLKALDLSGSKLKVLPEAMAALVELEVLDLFQAKATWKVWPASFAQLRKLKLIRAPLDRGVEVTGALKAAGIRAKVVTGGAVMP